MTNSSVKNSLFVGVAVAALLFSGAFASTVHADGMDMWGGFEGFSDFDAFDSGSFEQYYDNSFEDYSNNSFEDYSNNSFEPYNNSFDAYNNSFEPYTNDFQPYSSEAPVYSGSDGVQYTTTSGCMSCSGGGSSYSGGGYSYPVSIAQPYSIAKQYTAPKQTIAQATPSFQIQEQTSTNVNNNPNTNVNNNNNVNNININVPAQTTTVTPVYQFMPVQYPIVSTPAPYCTISISNNGVNQATLTWSSQNATSGFISPNVGYVSTYGARVVTAYGTQIFTMTVYGQNGQSANCQTTYNYVAPVAPTPYVSLSQIPYTGLDFGTTGMAIYWGSMIAFALAAGYLMVYYRGGALAFAGQMSARNARVNTSVQEDFKTLVTEKAEEKLADIVVEESKKASTFDLPTSTGRSTIDSMSVERNADGMPTIIINRG